MSRRSDWVGRPIQTGQTGQTGRMVVGLGNPGPDYHGTRHNVGFDLLDFLALHEGLLFESPDRLDGYSGPPNFSAARIHDPDALLVKPETFMNRSGEAVEPLLTWAGIEAKQCMIVFDDMDLDSGVLRMRPHGGAGGQKGMDSILKNTDTDRFPRLRIGIGRSETAAARHVLSAFPDSEREGIDAALANAAEAVLFWLRTGDIEACMTRFHSRWKRDSPSISHGGSAHDK